MTFENDNEIYYAKQVPIAELVTQAGYTPVKRGATYVLKEHDSFVIFPNTNSFCHYSQTEGNHHVGGSPIDFCCKYMGMSMKEAVDYLLELSGHRRGDKDLSHDSTKRYDVRKSSVESSKPGKEMNKEMILPKKHTDNKRVIAYLSKTRCIDIDVVRDMIKRGRIYESATHHNCVFVTYDSRGNPRYASQRGTVTENPFKADVKGSDKMFGFPIYRSESNKVIVFEAPIDLLSYISLYPEDPNNLLALGCLSPKGLYRFLSQHQHIDTVSFLLDNDGVGPEAAYAATDMLLTHGYKVEEHELASAMEEIGVKDVNDYLVNIRQFGVSLSAGAR